MKVGLIAHTGPEKPSREARERMATQNSIICSSPYDQGVAENPLVRNLARFIPFTISHPPLTIGVSLFLTHSLAERELYDPWPQRAPVTTGQRVNS